MSSPGIIETSEARKVNAENPWPGLAAFTADNRAFFKGRDAECRELLQRVRNAGNVTVLYGLSGLGKTSLIQAGLVPKLEEEEYLPLVMRLDHEIRGAAAENPPLIEQIRQALIKTLPPSAAGPALAEPTLWRMLHRRDLAIEGREGRKLLPMIILDQFEEIFSLGVATQEQAKRSDAFFRDLCDLGLGRVPPDVTREREQLQAKIEENDSRFAEPGADHAALEVERENLEAQFNLLALRDHRYEILLALREDYYPYLESKARRIRASALVENRMRLLPLEGSRALEAVTVPGGHLLAEGTAREIVLSVGRVGMLQAGTALSGDDGEVEMETVQVEPAFLSLMCEQLNEDRKTREAKLVEEGKLPPEERPLKITPVMVREKRDVVLESYYDRCLQTLPQIRSARERDCLAGFIETKLLSDYGQFRLQVPVADARAQLKEAGVDPEVLETLVHRHRLLRIEHRGVPRIELTHDVLTGVVAARRAVREGREKIRQRAKRVIVGVGVVMLLAIVILAGIALRNEFREKELRRIAEEKSKLAQEKTTLAEKETERANKATDEVKRLGEKSVKDMRESGVRTRNELGGWYRKEVQRAIDEGRYLDAHVILAEAAEVTDNIGARANLGPQPLMGMLAPAPALRSLRHYTMAVPWRAAQFSPDGSWITAVDIQQRLLLVPRDFAGRENARYLAEKDGQLRWESLANAEMKTPDAASVRAHGWQPATNGKSVLAVGTPKGVWLVAPTVEADGPRKMDTGINAEVTALAFQRDARRLFVGYANGAIVALNLSTGKCDETFQPLPPEPNSPGVIESRSRDGLYELRATGADDDEEDDRVSRKSERRLTIRVNLPSAQEVELNLRGDPETALFSPNGNSLVVVCKTTTFSWNPKTVLYPLPTREELEGGKLFQFREQMRRPVELASGLDEFSNVAFSPNGELLAVVAKTRLSVWTSNGKSQLVETDFGGELVTPAIVWGSVAKGEDETFSSSILLVSTDREKGSHLVRAYSLVGAVSSAATTRATQSRSGTNSESERTPNPSKDARYELKALSNKAVKIGGKSEIFVPLADGRSGIVSGGKGNGPLRVDATGKDMPVKATGEQLRQAIGSRPLALAQDATGGFLLAGLANGELRWLSIADGRVAMIRSDGWGSGSPGDLLCDCSANHVVTLRDGTLRRLSYEPYRSNGQKPISDEDRTFRAAEKLLDHDGSPGVGRSSRVGEQYTAAAFAPDGRTRWVGLSSGKLRAESVGGEDDAHAEQIAAHAKPVSVLVFSADGQLMISASEDGSVRLWETRPPNERRAVLSRLPQRSSREGLSRESRRLLGDFGVDGTLRVSDGELIFRWDGLTEHFVYEAVQGLGDDPGDRVIGVQGSTMLWLDSTKDLRLWDFARQAGRTIGPRPSGYEGTITLSPDGHWLAIESNKKGEEKTGIFSIANNGLGKPIELPDVSGVRFGPDSKCAAWLVAAKDARAPVQVAWIALTEPTKVNENLRLGVGGFGQRLEAGAEGSDFVCVASDEESDLRLWRINLEKGIAEAAAETAPDVSSLRVGGTPHIVVTVGGDDVLRVWEWPLLRPLLSRTIAFETNWRSVAKRVLISPRGDALAVLGGDAEAIVYTAHHVAEKEIVKRDAGMTVRGEAQLALLNPRRHDLLAKINSRTVPAHDEVRTAWLRSVMEVRHRRERYFLEESPAWDDANRRAVTQPARDFLNTYAGRIPTLDAAAERMLLFSRPLAEIEDVAWLRDLLSGRERVPEPIASGIRRDLDAIGSRLPAAMWDEVRFGPVNAAADDISKLIQNADISPRPEGLPAEIKKKVDALRGQLAGIFGENWNKKENPPKAPERVIKIADQFRKFAENWRADKSAANSKEKRGKLAQQWIQDALDLDPASFLNWNRLGSILSDMHREEEAVAAYRTAIRFITKLDDWGTAVASLRTIRLLDDAVVISEWLSIERPDDVYNLVELGELRRQAGHPLNDSLEAFAKAEKLEVNKKLEDRDDALRGWKANALMQGFLSGEVVAVEQILAEDKAEITRQEAAGSEKNVADRSSAGKWNLAKDLWLLGRMEESEQLFREVKDHYISAKFYLGWQCLKTQRELEGQKLLDGLIGKLQTKSGDVIDWPRIHSLALRGQRDRAMKELAAIEKVQPGDKLTLALERARVEALAERLEGATAQLAEAVRAGLVDVAEIEQDLMLAPLAKHPPVQQLIAALKTPANRPDRSLGLARFYAQGARPAPTREVLYATVAPYFAEALRKGFRDFDSLLAEPYFSALVGDAEIANALQSARQNVAHEVKSELATLAEAARRALGDARPTTGERKTPGWEDVDAHFSRPTRLRSSKGTDVFGRKYLLDFARREVRPHPDTVKELAGLPGMEKETWVVELATRR